MLCLGICQWKRKIQLKSFFNLTFSQIFSKLNNNMENNNNE